MPLRPPLSPRSPAPGLPWIGYNLFRLTAVVFLCWALVAQFIAIANDLSIYSKTPSSAAAANGSIINSTKPASPSASSSGTGWGAGTSSLGVATSSSRNPYAAPSVQSTPTTSAAIGVVASSAAAPNRGTSPTSEVVSVAAPAAEDDESADEAKAEAVGAGRLGTTATINGAGSSIARRGIWGIFKRDRSATEAEEAGEANWGLSSVPRQSGGMIFTVLSRLIIASTIGLLIFGQLGWPEMFLYRHIPWLGPQSVPLWLGLVQSIVSIEILRVHSGQSVLLPAFGLLAIGLVNMILGGALLWLARKMPKKPAPPLYFSHTTRLLFFTRPPACYDQLFRRASPSNIGEEHSVNKGLPPSNSHSIRLDTDDEGGKYHSDVDVEKALPVRDTTHTRFERGLEGGQLPIEAQHPSRFATLNANTDVRQGGYPTFSGGGLADPGRQVPTGFLERGKDGRLLKFVSEDGQETKPPSSLAQGTTSRSNGTAAPAPASGAGSVHAPATKVVRKISGRRKPPPSAWDESKTTDAGSSAQPQPKSSQTAEKSGSSAQQKREDLPPRGQSRKQTVPQTAIVPKHPGRGEKAAGGEDSDATPLDTSIASNLVMSPLRRADSVDTIALISRGKPGRSQTHNPQESVGGGRRGGKGGHSIIEAAKNARKTRSRSSLFPFGLNLGSAFGDSKLSPSNRRYSQSADPLPPPKAVGREEERPDSLCSISVTTNELGPRFPLPPARQGTLGVVSEADAGAHAHSEDYNSEPQIDEFKGKGRSKGSSRDQHRDDKATAKSALRESEATNTATPLNSSAAKSSLTKKPSVREERSGPVPPKRTNSKKGKEEDGPSGKEDTPHRSHEDATNKSERKAEGKGKGSRDALLIDHSRREGTERVERHESSSPRTPRMPKTPKSPKTAKPTKTPKSPSEPTSRSRSRSNSSSEAVAVTGPSTPSTARSSRSSLRDSFRLSGFRVRSPSTSTWKRAATLHSHTQTKTPALRPSLADLGRSASTRSTRTARGVRFALSPAKSTASTTSSISDQRNGAGHEEGLSAWEIDERGSVDLSRAQAQAKVVRVEAKVEPSPKRSKSFNVLGGGYLDGGRESI